MLGQFHMTPRPKYASAPHYPSATSPPSNYQHPLSMHDDLPGDAPCNTRPLSMASVSSLGSGTQSSYSSHESLYNPSSRRVSQSYFSPLSPALSEPCESLSYPFFSTLNEDDESPSAEPSLEQSSLPPSYAFCNGVQNTSSSSSSNSSTNSLGHRRFFSHGANDLRRRESQLQQFYENNRLASLRGHVPSEVRLRLNYHLDECWFLHFSPSGQYLASTGLDQSIILWRDLETPEPTVHKTLQFSRTITHVEWSPDSKYLLVNFGYDPARPAYATELSLIQVETGETVHTQRHRDGMHDIPIMGIGWMTDAQRYITAPQNGSIYIWNLKGEVEREVLIDDRSIQWMQMIPGQNAALILTDERRIEVLSIDGDQASFRYVDTIADKPTGVRTSPDESYLAIAMKSNDDLCRPAQILIYDFRSLTFLRALEADSYVNEAFIVMPTFLGPNSEILCSGSENGKVHMWDIETGELIQVLEEHSKHCGWMATHPTIPGLMASCSDDNHIIIWVTKELSRSLRNDDEKWVRRKRMGVSPPPVDIKNGW
ncbi:hypothetical protein BGX34_010356 [Mortierella sp. NVP85]|nr:hypothetical protein BGX34_010356 [Mortierella sp. NVP85]